MNHWVLKRYVFLLILLAGAGCSVIDSVAPAGGDTAFQVPIDLEGSLQNPAWSPDGRYIVFTRFKNGYNQGPADLVVYELESGETRILVSDGSDNVNLTGYVWNRTTNQIVFSSSREPHDEIYRIRADAKPGEEVQVTHRDRLVAYEPSFSPDGEWVVFESHPLDVETNGIITKFKIDGTSSYQDLTGANDDCRQPNWSPDGKLILFQMWINDQWEIWLMNVDGTDKRQITSGPGDKTDASFSPDGHWIVYSGDGPTIEQAELFFLPAAGGDAVQITHNPYYDGAPSWSPEGRKVVFERSAGDTLEPLETSIWIIDVK